MPENANEKPVSKLATKSLIPLGQALRFIGQPLFFLLSYGLIFVLFIFYWLGQTLQNFLRTTLSLIVKIFSKIKPAKLIKARRPKFPKPKRVPWRFLVLVGIFVFAFWFFILRDLPTPKELVERDQEVSTKIYDRNGRLLFKIYKDKNRTPVSLNQIPVHVRLATLAAEDAEFYRHPGFSIRGILRAMIRNATRGELTGGSTITQQLVKNALLSPEKTILRKIKEIILAVGVELTFSKDQILEMYFNEVSYGGTAYGIQEAARAYFGKNVEDLSLAEAALLAGLPKSPTKFSPFGPNPDLAFKRQKEVLNLMVINRYITKKQAEEAKKEKLVFAPNKIDIKAPHFVMYIRRALVEKYGEEVVEKGGLEVITTLDYSIQKLAEWVVKEEVDKLSSLHVTNGAALVITPQTGEILAMVGSKDYFDTQNDGNVNVLTRLRQPGSAIKVINYAYALANGYTAATILSDTPTTFYVPGQPPYSPKNYDGQYRGNLSLRSALAESRNIPATKVLASYGVSKMIALGQKMGITTWNDPSRYGLSLTLGGGDVKLIDLARVYATLANYGRRPELVSILKVTNYKGKVLEKNECLLDHATKITDQLEVWASEAKIEKDQERANCNQEQVVDPRVAFLLIDILSDNQARAPAFGYYSQLVIPGHPEVAVKTGTSNNLRDNLTIGFNQKYLTAVWVGNNDNSPMSRVASGITGASSIWHKIMAALLADEKSQPWPPPEGLEKIAICPLTGTLPCEGCPIKYEWFIKGTAPKAACQLKQTKKQKPPRQILEPAAKTENPPLPTLSPPRIRFWPN